jgi:KaiC/GvpD/RAD55 family RecA-like ATPase/5S rRNA maturation endonuclease (ribonuclease M5)
MQLEDLKDRVKLIDYVEQNGARLEKAGQNAYRINPCPICGHKDHFTVYPDSNSYTSFSGCCQGGSIIDYMIEVEGLSQNEAISKLKKMAGDTSEILSTRSKPTLVVKEPEVKKLSEGEKNEIALMVNEASKHQPGYFESRGLSAKTISKYKLGYLPQGHNKLGKSFKYVLPVSEKFVIIRSNNEKDRYRNIGNTEILNTCYIEDGSLTDKKIFITEGYFDALSLEEIGFAAISLNSTAMCDNLIKNIMENKDKVKDKQFILALDNDQGGRETTVKIKKALSELKVPFAELTLKNYKDINQYLIEDRSGLLEEISKLPLKGTIYEYLSEEFELDQLKRLSEPDIKTGIDNLDYNLGGGLYPGLYVLGAISSLGKTALALQIADKIASQGHQVLFFSLEMGRYEMTCRSLARVIFEKGGAKDLTTGNVLKTSYRGKDIYSQDFFISAMHSYKESAAKNLTIEEGNFDLDINMLRQLVAEHTGRTGQRPVVIVDYLQVLRPIDMRITEKQHIDMTIVELKRLSRDLDMPVIAVSSFNRANYKTDVTFEAFKESGAIEYTADVVLALQLRKNGDEDINKLKNLEPRPLELVLLKNRRGKAYDVIDLDYWPKQNYFAEV